jgi:hypothetical protein
MQQHSSRSSQVRPAVCACLVRGSGGKKELVLHSCMQLSSASPVAGEEDGGEATAQAAVCPAVLIAYPDEEVGNCYDHHCNNRAPYLCWATC